jgi:hypothetical protein
MSLTTRTDHRALEASIDAARAESPSRCQQIDAMLAEGRDWLTVGRFAAYSAQIDSLGLMPWQDPPCVINLAHALEQPFGDQRGEREAGELLARMQRLGISKYHPDPAAAIAEAERERPVP